MKNKKLWISLGIISSIAIIGASIYLTLPKPRDPLVNSDTTFSADEAYEKESFYKGLNAMRAATKNGNVTEVIAIADSNVSTKDKETSSQYILELVENLISLNGNVVPSNEIIQYLNENRATLNNIDEVLAKSNNQQMIEGFNSLKKGYYTFYMGDNEKYVNEHGRSRIGVDYEKLLLKYDNYLTEEVKDYLLLKKDIVTDYFITETAVDFDALVKNIEMTELFKKKHPNHYYDTMLDHFLENYYKTYFGYRPLSHVYDNETFKLSNRAWKSYLESSKREDLLGERAKKMIEVLEKNNKKMNIEVLKFIEELLEIKDGMPIYSWYEYLGEDNPHKDSSGDVSIPGRQYIIDSNTLEIIGEINPATNKPVEEEVEESEYTVEILEEIYHENESPETNNIP